MYLSLLGVLNIFAIYIIINISLLFLDIIII